MLMTDVSNFRTDLPWQAEAEVPDPVKPTKADLQLWSVTTIIARWVALKD